MVVVVVVVVVVVEKGGLLKGASRGASEGA